MDALWSALGLVFGHPLQFWQLPEDVSVHGAGIDRLLIAVHVFMAVLFVGWGAFYLYCLVKFRARAGHTATYVPPHARITSWLEVGVVVVEVALLFGLSMPLWGAYKNSPPPDSSSLHVHVVAEQYAWNFHYAGKDGVFGRTRADLISSDNPLGLDPDDPAGKDDVTTINQLHLRVNQPVIVELTSKDVIHSFSIPVMRVKQDVIPGQRIPIWWTAVKTGTWEIACAQLCGLGHYRMRGMVTVDTAEDFDKWLAENAPAAQ
ncbi:MAG: cytochrome c oxidase subunit II [Deltaproteobacteria bacterium]|nr:cytochrome c oxidase subunit II [Deltaproteobacteria bacterium]